MAQKRDALGGLESQVVELPLTEGLKNTFSQHFRAGPQDAIFVAENVELSEIGKFKNRDGYVSLSNIRTGVDAGSSTIVGTQQKLFQHRNELGVIASSPVAIGSGAGWGGDGDTVLTYSANTPAGSPLGGWKAHGKIPRPTLGNLGNLTPDTNVRISDCAVAGNFMIVAWHTATNTGSAYGDVFFRVIDITTNTTVIDTTQCPGSGTYIPARTNTVLPAIGTNAARNGVGKGYQAKLQCVALGNRLYVFLLAAADSGVASLNDVVCFYVDMAITNPVPSALFALATGVISYAATTDGANIFLAYVLNPANQLKVTAAKFNNALTLLGANVATTFSAPEITIYDIACSAAFGVFAITCITQRAALDAKGVAQYALATDTTNSLTVVATPVNFCEISGPSDTSNFSLFRPDIVLFSSTDMVACVSYENDFISVGDVGIRWNILKITAGAMTNVSLQGSSGLAFNFGAQGIVNVAKMFVMAQRVFLPVAKVDHFPASGLNVDAGYFVVELDCSPSQSTTDRYRLPMMVANWATDISAPVLDTSLVSPYLPIDYGPIMIGVGGGPTITLVSTSTLADGTPSTIRRPLSIYVKVLTNGAFGTWDLLVSYDNFVTTTQTALSAALVPLTGPGAGFSLSIANASANTSQSWHASYRSTRQIALANGCVAGNKYYISTRSGAALGNTPTPLFSGYKLEAIVLDYVDPYRWLSRPSAGVTVFGGSAMYAYDGRRTFEAGVPCRPRIVDIANRFTGVINYTAQKLKLGSKYFFRAVTTWLDANGDRWFSAPSYASRDGDAFSATATAVYTGTLRATPALATTLQAIISISGYAKDPNFTGSVLITVKVAGGISTWTADVSYDNGATVAFTFTHTTAPIALQGAALGLSITISNDGAILGESWEVVAQQFKLQVEVPAAFSGMVSGVDYFKNAAEVWLYMTTSDSVSIYFLVGQAKVDQGSLAQFSPFQRAPWVQFTVGSEPALTADQIYTAGGELENSPAPSARILEAHRDRMLALSGYDNRVYYTKPKVAGRGLEWCQQTQFIEIPETGMGIASNETCFMVFTARGVYAVEGYGPSATGQPANAFGTLQLVSNQVGLYEVNSCRATPIGVFFRTSQGWWLIDRSLTLQFIGEDLGDAIATQDITLAISVDQRMACIRIMMLQASQSFVGYKTFNYWYDSKRWSTDANVRYVTHKHAMVFGETYFMIDEADVLARQGALYGTSWLDGRQDTLGHGPSVSTGWITVANLAMLKRIWRVIVVVENNTPGLVTNQTISLVVWGDWSDAAPVLVKTWTADQIGAGVQTLRAHLPKQKMKAIKISVQQGPITGVAADNNNPGYNLIGLGFQIGLKERLSTEPATRST